ncbi:MAG: acyl-ACP--UDP-N-acetylglucosamine O-acyltransferase [Candidatus Cloacimonetes bacterium]|nr:acyl-ACP--UDP-N-acetylglucosamine O-acyltransferase [Candidatus Cloacimonadota bacterium]MBL7108413.1 acyl-ACP--UDP-N-acetylglucosamine O-acyltransferase [Candidatus Cloacimonadota bacterium]
MRTKIHKTAIIHKDSQIDENVEIGPNTIIGSQVKIGKNVKIASNVLIDGKTTVGDGCKIFHSAVVGSEPQDLKYKGENTETVIGSGTIIREFVSVNRSTDFKNPTKIGNNCLLMAYVHCAHDCQLDDNVILANCVNLSGHIQIEKNVIIGGMTPIHQFVKIGCYAFVGGFSRVTQDVAPYLLGTGIPFKIVGLNSVGLKRNNFSKKKMKILKQMFKIFYLSDLNTSQAVSKIKNELEIIDEIKHFLDFVKASERGISK